MVPGVAVRNDRGPGSHFLAGLSRAEKRQRREKRKNAATNDGDHDDQPGQLIDGHAQLPPPDGELSKRDTKDPDPNLNPRNKNNPSPHPSAYSNRSKSSGKPPSKPPSISQIVEKVSTFTRIVTKFARFVGPGFLVSVAYIDPGNYSTGAAAGAAARFKLLFVVLLSNLFAIFLQSLCIKLGSVTGLNLAENCRKHLPKWLNILLYVFAESAIIATDIAEVRKLIFCPPHIFILILMIGHRIGNGIEPFATYSTCGRLRDNTR
jgi:hypothetical protein